MRDLARFIDTVKALAELGVINWTEARGMIVAAADLIGLSSIVTPIRPAA